MRGAVGQGQFARTIEIAVDRVVVDQFFDGVDRAIVFEEHLECAILAISLNRGPEADCQSCSGHAAIAARSAPADGIPLEQDDRSSLLSKLERSRQTGESTTDD